MFSPAKAKPTPRRRDDSIQELKVDLDNLEKSAIRAKEAFSEAELTDALNSVKYWYDRVQSKLNQPDTSTTFRGGSMAMG